ncbi:MAG TPA: hypothetical protein VGW34_03670 [Allosphingosinicella sp.]|nr:hypothetical protein [Allosphingosinicella sp.]
MSHSTAIPLEWGRETVAYFSKLPARRLMVFVHGFGGGSASTWSGAETQLISDSRTGATDIVFYGYNSLRAQPELSAGKLRAFLRAAASASADWNRVIASALGEPVARVYDDVLIVAHSLGAPVARRAVLDSISEDAPWVDRVRLLLFAPAHMGALLSKLQKELSGTMGGLVASIAALAKLRVLPLDGLEPGSPFLNQLLSDSDKALKKGWADQVRARQVIFGDEEAVVLPQRFLEDPPPEVWEGYGHCEICRCPKTVPAIVSHL